MEDDKILRRERIYRTIMLIIFTAFITFIVTTAYIYKFKPTLISDLSDGNVKLIAELQKIQQAIDKYYLNDIDEDALIEGAVAGYVDALGDKYTEYIGADDMLEYTAEILGNYKGIGVYITKNIEKNLVEVITPIPESPAEKAGIKPGDFIKRINGKEYTGEELTEVSTALKSGEIGDKINIEILRGEENLEIQVSLEEVNLNPLSAEVLENDIGYINLPSFDEDSAKKFKEKFDEINSKGIKSLILDLRDNGGGLVEEALTIADYFTDKGSNLLVTVNKNGKESIRTAKKDPIINIPVVVLVNGGTASASEILTGALKDLKKATIVGTKTYGKGVIQNFLQLEGGSGLKVTTAEYFTPNKTKINGIGIEPDINIELPKELQNVVIVTKEQDIQLQKAIETLSKGE